MTIKKLVLVKWYKFKYRKVDDDVCCCGARNCDGDFSHSYVNAKEYAINQSVKRYIK